MFVLNNLQHWSSPPGQSPAWVCSRAPRKILSACRPCSSAGPRPVVGASSPTTSPGISAARTTVLTYIPTRIEAHFSFVLMHTGRQSRRKWPAQWPTTRSPTSRPVSLSLLASSLRPRAAPATRPAPATGPLSTVSLFSCINSSAFITCCTSIRVFVHLTENWINLKFLLRSPYSPKCDRCTHTLLVDERPTRTLVESSWLQCVQLHLFCERIFRVESQWIGGSIHFWHEWCDHFYVVFTLFH